MNQPNREVLETMQAVIGKMLNPEMEGPKFERQFCIEVLQSLSANMSTPHYTLKVDDHIRALNEASEVDAESFAELLGDVIERYGNMKDEEARDDMRKEMGKYIDEINHAVGRLENNL